MAKQRRASILSQLGSEEAWGLSKEEMCSFWGMRIMPGEGGCFPPQVQTVVAVICMIRHSRENNLLTNTNRPLIFLRQNFKGIFK